MTGALISFGVACAGGEEKPSEPVAEAPPMVPDAPGGDAGESTEKPAGTGQANGAAPAPAKGKGAAKGGKAPPAHSGPASGPMVVDHELVNVRGGAGMSHQVVRTVKQGDKVQASACKAGWCQIGENEFVARRFLKAE